MDIIFKAAAAGILGSLTALLIKRSNPELALVCALAASVFTLGLAMSLGDGIRELVQIAQETSGLAQNVLAPVSKCVGIGITASLAGNLCRDSGQSALASSVELAGALAAIYTALPLMKTLLQMVGGLV